MVGGIRTEALTAAEQRIKSFIDAFNTVAGGFSERLAMMKTLNAHDYGEYIATQQPANLTLPSYGAWADSHKQELVTLGAITMMASFILPGVGQVSALRFLPLAAAALTGLVVTWGALTFTRFIMEEAMQTQGIGVYVLVNNRQWLAASKFLDIYEGNVNTIAEWYTAINNIDPTTGAKWQIYIDAMKQQIAAYRIVIDAGLAKEAAKIEAEIPLVEVLPVELSPLPEKTPAPHRADYATADLFSMAVTNWYQRTKALVSDWYEESTDAVKVARAQQVDTIRRDALLEDRTLSGNEKATIDGVQTAQAADLAQIRALKNGVMVELEDEYDIARGLAVSAVKAETEEEKIAKMSPEERQTYTDRKTLAALDKQIAVAMAEINTIASYPPADPRYWTGGELYALYKDKAGPLSWQAENLRAKLEGRPPSEANIPTHAQAMLWRAGKR